MLQNSWTIKLAEAPQHVTTSLLPDPSIVYQGSSNQLLVHKNNQTITLPIRKEVLALQSINQGSQQSEQSSYQQILLLTKYSLLCFDFLNNQQKFCLEFENAEQMYAFNQCIYVSCADSLYCYDFNGEEHYVNHFTQSIACIAPKSLNFMIQKQEKMKENNSGVQIYIGFADMTMSKYCKENLVYDYGKVVGVPVSLCSVDKGVMVGTKQGTLAYYESKKSKWKAKSSNPVAKIIKLCLQEAQHVIVLRQNGLVELRDWKNGSTISKIKTGQPIIDGFIMDFRKQKFQQILCILQSGLIKAFNLIEGVQADKSSNIRASQPMTNDIEVDANYLQSLQSRKADLIFEIEKLNEALKSKQTQTEQNQGPILQDNFNLKGVLEYQKGLIFKLNATNGYISGLTFQQAIMPVLVEKTQELKYKFQENNEIAGNVNCQILVHSSFSATRYEIRNISIVLPKFWKWGLTANITKKIEGKLKFKMAERNARYLKWIKQCFFINISQKEQERLESLSVMKLRFLNYYENQQMQIKFSSTDGCVEIDCDCLKTMGDIVQDLVNYTGYKDLNTELYLPKEKQKIKEDLATVERLSQTKISISTEMAQATNTIKFLLVKGESARLIGSMNTFRRSFTQIMQQNRNLLTQIQKKNQNTKILSETMKKVGQFINKIANIRYGDPKAKVISQCRQAIKNKKFPQIITLMDQGVQM